MNHIGLSKNNVNISEINEQLKILKRKSYMLNLTNVTKLDYTPWLNEQDSEKGEDRIEIKTF